MMNSFGPPPLMSQPMQGGWPQQPPPPQQQPQQQNQQPTVMNGSNQPQPNIIPQMANLNLSGPSPYEPQKQQQQQNQFLNQQQQMRPPSMQQNGPPPTNNFTPMRQQQQNGPPPQIQAQSLNQPPLNRPPSTQPPPAVLPINSEMVENNSRPPSQPAPVPMMMPPPQQPNNMSNQPQFLPPTSKPLVPLNSGSGFPPVNGVGGLQSTAGSNLNPTPANIGAPPTSAANSGWPPNANVPPTSTPSFPPAVAGNFPPTPPSSSSFPPISSGITHASVSGATPTMPGQPPQTSFPGAQNKGIPGGNQPGFPPQPMTNQPGFPPAPLTNQPGFPQQPVSQPGPPSNQPGFPPQSAGQPGFPQQPINQPGPPSNQPGFPPQPVGQPGFPQQPISQPGPPSNQPGYPQQPNTQPGFPPQSGGRPPQTLSQTAGFTSQPTSQPGFPPHPTGQPGFPPQAVKQPGFPSQPSNQPGFPPQPTTQPGFPPQPGNPGFPPQSTSQLGYQQQPTGQPGFPPQPSSQPGFPPQVNSPPGFPVQPIGYPPQASGPPGFQPQGGGPQGFQPQQANIPPGFPPMPGAQPSGYPGQPAPYANSPHMPPQQPGRPQQPGMYNQMPANFPAQPGIPQAPQRRLDPDQMPNPIEVMNENDNACSGPFITNQPGQVPPLVTTEFVTQDQGNSGPRFIRSSMYNVPATQDMMKQAAVPFSLMISPFAKTAAGELTPPIVDFGELGPIRCVRCKAYMSPNMQFIDGGRRFRCMLCEVTTEVPSEYFQHLDHTGQRVDKYERPELVLGTYEFVATKDYCQNNVQPKVPALIFIIDVSYNNIKSGLVHLLCAEMKRIIKNLPIDQNSDKSLMKVGFITYNNTVHFYNIKNNLAQPQMMVVGDVQEMFMPLLDGFLCDPDESGFVIDALMDQIPKMFGESRETETILLPAIQAGLEALKASECAGKLLVFNSSLPSWEAPGKLRNRDDRKLLGTDKEKTVLVPQTTAYNNLGQDCVAAGCSVDLYVFNNSYIDVATIGQVSRLTGGEVYKYTYFQADIDGKRLVNDIIKNISRPIGFDAVMRVRTSTGIRPTDFYGHFFMSNTTDVQLASVDSEKSIGIEIKHDDKLKPEDNVYIQVAILYTSCSGQRRLRVLNLCLKICLQMADMFRSCDLDTTMLYFAKQSIFKLMDSTPKQVKDSLVARCAQILACYRKNCATITSAGQLILPECMKLLPLYTSCILKNDAISGGSDMTVDDRSYVMQYVLSMSLPMSVKYIYPRLIPIHDVDADESETVPAQIRCSSEKMLENGAYILENGIHMFIWLGLGLTPEFCQSVFGVQHATQIDTDKNEFPVFDNPLSKRVREIVNYYQQESSRCMRITFVRQRDKLENVFKHFLVEDRGTDGTPSYVDFLCHMHKEIRQLLS